MPGGVPGRRIDVRGVSLFPIAGGGTCGTGEVRIVAGGVPFGSRTIATPDQNGDWMVSEDDLAVLVPKIGRHDPSGDLNCDGIVTAVDLSIAWSHVGHRGDLVTVVASASGDVSRWSTVEWRRSA